MVAERGARAEHRDQPAAQHRDRAQRGEQRGRRPAAVVGRSSASTRRCSERTRGRGRRPGQRGDDRGRAAVGRVARSGPTGRAVRGRTEQAGRPARRRRSRAGPAAAPAARPSPPGQAITAAGAGVRHVRRTSSAKRAANGCQTSSRSACTASRSQRASAARRRSRRGREPAGSAAAQARTISGVVSMWNCRPQAALADPEGLVRVRGVEASSVAPAGSVGDLVAVPLQHVRRERHRAEQRVGRDVPLATSAGPDLGPLGARPGPAARGRRAAARPGRPRASAGLPRPPRAAGAGRRPAGASASSSVADAAAQDQQPVVAVEGAGSASPAPRCRTSSGSPASVSHPPSRAAGSVSLGTTTSRRAGRSGTPTRLVPTGRRGAACAPSRVAATRDAAPRLARLIDRRRRGPASRARRGGTAGPPGDVLAVRRAPRARSPLAPVRAARPPGCSRRPAGPVRLWILDQRALQQRRLRVRDAGQRVTAVLGRLPPGQPRTGTSCRARCCSPASWPAPSRSTGPRSRPSLLVLQLLASYAVLRLLRDGHG